MWQSGVCETCRPSLLENSVKKAARAGHVKCVILAIEAGDDVNNCPNWWTALMEAAQKGYTECVESLIKAGADVNKRDDKNCTPLIFAAENGHTKCVQLLIGAGADLNTFSSNKQTALMKAAEKGHTECVELLIKSMGDKDSHGNSPLVIMARYPGHGQCVDELMKVGVDVNQSSWKGHTPLMVAARSGNEEYLGKLLLAGAEINLCNQLGCNAIELCLMFVDNDESKKNIVKLLDTAGGIIRKSSIPVPEYLKEANSGGSLSHKCRLLIRKHLIEMDSHKNLFHSVPRLGLPSTLSKYLLYDDPLYDEV